MKVVVEPGSHRFIMRAWCSTAEVKQRLQHATGCSFSWMRLFHGNAEIHNSQRLIELLDRRPSRRRASPISPSHRTLKLSLKVQNPRDLSGGTYVAPWGAADLSALGRPAEKMMARIGEGIGQGLSPSLALDGMGGTYVLRDAKRRPVAAFKPRDEEPFAPNNPRGLAGKMGQPGIHPTIPSGESHVREVLTYSLDHHGFAAVPPTMQAEAMHPAFHVQSMRPLSRYGAKVGSLQAWVPHTDLAADLGYHTFPTEEVHKLAILDMRLLNTDRNDGNILVTTRSAAAEGGCKSRDRQQRASSGATLPADATRASSDGGGGGGVRGGGGGSVAAGAERERSRERHSARDSGDDELDADVLSRERDRSAPAAPNFLVPIDHGGVLPTRPEVVWYNWCWLSWPQISEPLSHEALEYVARLDPVKDARHILDAGLPLACARICRCATRTLQAGVAAGLNLLEVSTMLARQQEELPSDVERLWAQADQLALSAFRNHRLRGAPSPVVVSSSNAVGRSMALPPHAAAAHVGAGTAAETKPTAPMLRKTMSCLEMSSAEVSSAQASSARPTGTIAEGGAQLPHGFSAHALSSLNLSSLAADDAEGSTDDGEGEGGDADAHGAMARGASKPMYAANAASLSSSPDEVLSLDLRSAQQRGAALAAAPTAASEPTGPARCQSPCSAPSLCAAAGGAEREAARGEAACPASPTSLREAPRSQPDHPPSPTTPDTLQRSLAVGGGGLHRRIASSSSLVGMDATARLGQGETAAHAAAAGGVATDGARGSSLAEAGVGGSSSWRPPPSCAPKAAAGGHSSSSCRLAGPPAGPPASDASATGAHGHEEGGGGLSLWDDEDAAIEALFFVYFERLLEDAIKRVGRRKEAALHKGHAPLHRADSAPLQTPPPPPPAHAEPSQPLPPEGRMHGRVPPPPVKTEREEELDLSRTCSSGSSEFGSTDLSASEGLESADSPLASGRVDWHTLTHGSSG